MLLENFYKIIHIKEREDGKQAIEIELNPGHVLYQGHFPGQPVVPGVCTLQIIKESAEQIANQPLQYVQIASSKFLSAINPLETPLLQLFIRLEETEEHLFKLQAEGICNGKEFNCGRPAEGRCQLPVAGRNGVHHSGCPDHHVLLYQSPVLQHKKYL